MLSILALQRQLWGWKKERERERGLHIQGLILSTEHAVLQAARMIYTQQYVSSLWPLLHFPLLMDICNDHIVCSVCSHDLIVKENNVGPEKRRNKRAGACSVFTAELKPVCPHFFCILEIYVFIARLQRDAVFNVTFNGNLIPTERLWNYLE